MDWKALTAARKALTGGSAPAATVTAPTGAGAPPAEPDSYNAQAEADARKAYEGYLKTTENANYPDAAVKSWDDFWKTWQEGPSYASGEREFKLDEASEDLREGGYDQATADRYESEARSEIDPVFYAQSKALANDYARRGLSDSGMSAGAQEDASLRWAAQRRQANERAIDRATGDRRRQILDSAGLDIDLLNYDLQRQQLALQQEALDAQSEEDYWDDILGAGATVAGAYLGRSTGGGKH
jgi:hypothetical protein